MRGYLPHVKREGASYFVTFRLADSLPKAVLADESAEFEAQITSERAGGLIAQSRGGRARVRTRPYGAWLRQ